MFLCGALCEKPGGYMVGLVLLRVDPHSYTSGRWLRDDKHQRQLHRIDLNFDELCRRGYPSHQLAPQNLSRLLKWRRSNTRNTSIPIPEILDWSDDAVNIVGSEYIIMEHAAGIPL
ncbi:hypothetical protein N7447_003671 [Penicillium robsamsonii]|uniref:uncharacterized protein n=1 Tax=Penicillium robsamsonii TaxID=1792511 RepID=UPI002548BC53|nr:uncharacterized protein N7447_003671 [Penicillium robsamsonii]KAJ5826908.1 hypothetical protein N7447_003671 [Penicillium robsamsonii]